MGSSDRSPRLSIVYLANFQSTRGTCTGGKTQSVEVWLRCVSGPGAESNKARGGSYTCSACVARRQKGTVNLPNKKGHQYKIKKTGTLPVYSNTFKLTLNSSWTCECRVPYSPHSPFEWAYCSSVRRTGAREMICTQIQGIRSMIERCSQGVETRSGGEFTIGQCHEHDGYKFAGPKLDEPSPRHV